MDIYAYWEGDNRHWYYDLCWSTVKFWNPSAVLLTRRDVEDTIGRIPEELDSVYVTHRVDWIRKKWIAAVGGVWVDMDFICWSPLTPLASAAELFDYIGYKEWHGTGWMDNVFAARKGSPILTDAAEYALQQVRQYGAQVQWLATNAHAMNYAMERHKWGYWVQIPTHLISPVSVMDRDWFAAVDEAFEPFRFFSFGQITSFHGIGDWIKGRFRCPEDLLKSDTRLAALFGRALQVKR